MTHEELREWYPLYGLGAASAGARQEIESHLARRCEICTEEAERAQQTAEALRRIAQLRPHARKRVLEAAGLAERRFGSAPFLAAFCLLALFGAFYFSGRERDYATLAERLDGQLRSRTIEATRLQDIVAIVADPDAKSVPFGGTNGIRGRLSVSPAHGAFLTATHLTPGAQYEMSVGATPAGTFQADGSGNATYAWRGTFDPGLAEVRVKAGGAPVITIPPAR